MGQNQYYEGILQLRNPSKEAIKSVHELVNNKDNIYIAKEVKVKSGIDFYINNWRYLIEIGKKLKKKFGGENKTSKRLWGMNRQTSKQVYRVVVLLRLHKIKIGDIIDYKGKKVKIKELRKKISASDIKTGKRMFINYNEI